MLSIGRGASSSSCAVASEVDSSRLLPGGIHAPAQHINPAPLPFQYPRTLDPSLPAAHKMSTGGHASPSRREKTPATKKETSGATKGNISASQFYGEYYGHRVEHLSVLLPELRASVPWPPLPPSANSSGREIIWTAGDSSLDNKYWFADEAKAVGAYAKLLQPPTSRKDITYWLNYEAQVRGMNVAAINTAVEATTIESRTWFLKPQDVFLRDNIGPNDTLIVSLGGNDIAMAPTCCTIVNILGLVTCVPKSCASVACAEPLPCNDYCCGCCTSTLSACTGNPPCFGYLAHLFRTRLGIYVRALCQRTKPKRVIICMVYYPDETPTGGWADMALRCMKYESDPAKLQLVMRKMFEQAVSKIEVPGSEVVPFAMYDVLDGKITADYCQRVEPSPQGGRKLANAFLDIVKGTPKSAAKIAASPPQAPNSMGGDAGSRHRKV